jgi:hypothetical protein
VAYAVEGIDDQRQRGSGTDSGRRVAI